MNRKLCETNVWSVRRKKNLIFSFFIGKQIHYNAQNCQSLYLFDSTVANSLKLRIRQHFCWNLQKQIPKFIISDDDLKQYPKIYAALSVFAVHRTNSSFGTKNFGDGFETTKNFFSVTAKKDVLKNLHIDNAYNLTKEIRLENFQRQKDNILMRTLTDNILLHMFCYPPKIQTLGCIVVSVPRKIFCFSITNTSTNTTMLPSPVLKKKQTGNRQKKFNIALVTVFMDRIPIENLWESWKNGFTKTCLQLLISWLICIEEMLKNCKSNQSTSLKNKSFRFFFRCTQIFKNSIFQFQPHLDNSNFIEKYNCLMNLLKTVQFMIPGKTYEKRHIHRREVALRIHY